MGSVDVVSIGPGPEGQTLVADDRGVRRVRLIVDYMERLAFNTDQL